AWPAAELDRGGNHVRFLDQVADDPRRLPLGEPAMDEEVERIVLGRGERLLGGIDRRIVGVAAIVAGVDASGGDDERERGNKCDALHRRRLYASCVPIARRA